MATLERSARVCVFCGSSPGRNLSHLSTTIAFGQALCARGIGLVYGGGDVGLMGALADSVLASGGEVIGVIPEGLLEREVGHRGLTELRVVDSMHTRKRTMAELSDGFVALPGGFGTLEELFEVLTWAQLGIHDKPCALLNADGFYDPLLALLDHMEREEFIGPAHRALLIVESSVDALLDRLAESRIQPRLAVLGPEEM
jgi:uncharacterized protein (TIGR00730 family)